MCYNMEMIHIIKQAFYHPELAFTRCAAKVLYKWSGRLGVLKSYGQPDRRKNTLFTNICGARDHRIFYSQQCSNQFLAAQLEQLSHQVQGSKFGKLRSLRWDRCWVQATLILLQKMKIVVLALVFFHPGLGIRREEENFCCKDGETWINFKKVSQELSGVAV